MNGVVKYKNSAIKLEFLIDTEVYLEESFLAEVCDEIIFEFYDKLHVINYSGSSEFNDIDEIAEKFNLYENFSDVSITHKYISLVTYDNVSISVNRNIGLSDVIICLTVQLMTDYIKSKYQKLINFFNNGKL